MKFPPFRLTICVTLIEGNAGVLSADSALANEGAETLGIDNR
ncbi:unannotated protein [freshwater metagenome]|uniref:Unannotated protein n=1 Tax=freshwater metagenome TaxID=449393 RepID=A0A6J6XMP3_9ZZZZ